MVKIRPRRGTGCLAPTQQQLQQPALRASWHGLVSSLRVRTGTSCFDNILHSIPRSYNAVLYCHVQDWLRMTRVHRMISMRRWQSNKGGISSRAIQRKHLRFGAWPSLYCVACYNSPLMAPLPIKGRSTCPSCFHIYFFFFRPQLSTGIRQNCRCSKIQRSAVQWQCSVG